MEYTTKKFYVWPIFCVALLMTINSTELHAENTTDKNAVVETLNAKWNKAFNSGDAKAVAELYDQNAVLSPGNGTVLTGRDAIEGLFRSFIDNGVHNHTIEIIDTRHDGNIMYQTSNWKAYGQEQNGKKPSFGGVLVSIFHMDKSGTWKSNLHIWNLSENTE